MQSHASLTVAHVNKIRKVGPQTLRDSDRVSNTVAFAQPPLANPLDRLLKKAARKHKLAHPAASEPEQQSKNPQPLKDSSRQDTALSQGSKRHPQRPHVGHKQQSLAHSEQHQRQSRNTSIPDDNALLHDITEADRDRVRDSTRLVVEGNGKSVSSSSGRDGAPARQRLSPASARSDQPITLQPNSQEASARPAPAQPVASSSGFKGFGTPPAATAQHRINNPSTTTTTSATSPSKHVKRLPRSSAAVTRTPAAASPSPSPSPQQHKSASSPPPSPPPSSSSSATLRVFLFNAEETLTRQLLAELGLSGRVEVVGELKRADALVAAKMAKTGKHVNLAQGERTAANAGIPFVVVGRHMTANNLGRALQPLLDPASAEHLEDAAKSALAAGAGAQAAAEGVMGAASGAGDHTRSPTAAQLMAHRAEVLRGFTQMLLQTHGSETE